MVLLHILKFNVQVDNDMDGNTDDECIFGGEDDSEGVPSFEMAALITVLSVAVGAGKRKITVS